MSSVLWVLYSSHRTAEGLTLGGGQFLHVMKKHTLGNLLSSWLWHIIFEQEQKKHYGYLLVWPIHHRFLNFHKIKWRGERSDIIPVIQPRKVVCRSKLTCEQSTWMQESIFIHIGSCSNWTGYLYIFMIVGMCITIQNNCLLCKTCMQQVLDCDHSSVKFH